MEKKSTTQKAPKNVAFGQRRTRDATSHAVTSPLRLFASRAMAVKTISIDVVSDIV
jgi:hypothetical protein